MLRNYFKIGFRNLRRQPGYSLLNIGGLGLGLACCFLIVMYVQHELSFDRFHEKSDRIYRLVRHFKGEGFDERYAITSSGYAPHLKVEFPEIVHSARTQSFSPYLKVNGEQRPVSNFVLADPEILDIFDFPLKRGNPATALREPNTVLLTERAAEALFGREDPMGKVVRFNDIFDLTVNGILEDAPSNSHFQFEYLAPFTLITHMQGPDALADYTNFNYYTYVLLAPGIEPSLLEAKFPEYLLKYRGEEDAKAEILELQPLKTIHRTTNIRFDVGTNVDAKLVYIFSIIGLFILLIACVNYMNLATARAVKRAREVGVRKVVGAHRLQLIGQFLGESILLSTVAVLLAIALTLVLMPLFREMVGSSVQPNRNSLGLLVLLVGIGLMAGFIAGSYPALYLSAFRPVLVLKGEITRSRNAVWLRKGLIVLQFGISIFLIISTITVFNQLRYMKTQELGFDKEQVIFTNTTGSIMQNYDAFRQSLLANPQVQHVSVSGHLPGRAFTERGYNWPGDSGEEQGRGFPTIVADPDFLNTLGIELIAGRNFSREVSTDLTQAYILNETAARELGWEDPVGKPFRVWDQPEMGQVIGIVKDFHFKSLHQQIEPVVFHQQPTWYSYVTMRINRENMDQVLAFIGEKWKQFAPEYPFSYTFLDQDFDRFYRTEERLGQLFGFFAFIAIFVACLGLFGLASYSAEQRTKEIGIRKAMGASVNSIVLMLSREFTALVIVALAISAPLAYIVMNRWLEHFAYRTSMGAGTFLLTAVLALLIAWVSVSYQSARAAFSDPVKSLRYE